VSEQLLMVKGHLGDVIHRVDCSPEKKKKGFDERKKCREILDDGFAIPQSTSASILPR
jgi:hypothetical protein